MLVLPLLLTISAWILPPSGNWLICSLALVTLSPLLCLGLFILAGHSEISLRGHTLKATEALGPLRWSRRRRIERIDRFTVVYDENTASPTTFDPCNSCMVVAEGVGIKPLFVMVSYPREWGLIIGQELAGRSNASFRQETSGPATNGTASDLGSAVLDAASSSPPRPQSHTSDVTDVFRPPKGSGISSVQGSHDLVITVPSPGAIQMASHWLLAGVLLFMDGATALAMLLGVPVTGNLAHPVPMVLILLAALALLVRAFQLGRRRTTFRIQGSSLTVRQVDPFRSREWHWESATLRGIGCCPTGGGSRSIPQWQLEVHAYSGRRRTKLLAGYDRITLEWLTQVLLRTLRRQSHAGS